MAEINKPMDVPELNLQPPVTGKVRLTDDMQQTLALLCGYAGSARRILKSTDSGILNVCQPRIKDIIHRTAAASPVNMTGPDIPCTEIMCMGHPDNTGDVWVRTDSNVGASNAWPLGKKDVVRFTDNNLKQLNFVMTVGSERLIIAYS